MNWERVGTQTRNLSVHNACVWVSAGNKPWLFRESGVHPPHIHFGGSSCISFSRQINLGITVAAWHPLHTKELAILEPNARE